MKHILLPTDFSDNAWNAINYALKLFKNDTCKFYLLNAYTPVIYHVEYVLGAPAQFGMGDAIREVSLENLNDIKNRIATEFKNPNHSFETIASFNTLIPEIKDIVRTRNIDYVVMGTKGATGAKEVLFGSNTVHAFKSVQCPLLAIPDGFEYETPLEILFPSDYEVNFTDKHLEPLGSIAKSYHSRVNILHVDYGESLTEKQLKNKQRLESYFKSVAHLFHEVHNQNVTQAITEFQKKARINLLVMMNNKHSFFENIFFKSTLNQIGFHLNVPFMVIPTKT